jgi:hypothetical protein
LSIALTSVPPRQALLSWDGLAGSTNVVEYKTSLPATNWLVLTNVVVGPANEVITVRDPGSLSSERYYRVRLLAPPL